MEILSSMSKVARSVLSVLLDFLWGDLIKTPLPSGKTLEVSFLVLLLAFSGIYFTFKTRFVQIRMISKMNDVINEKNKNAKSFSGLHALVDATATRVGMGKLAGVVAAVSVGGAGSIFWMWVFAMLGSSLAFVDRFWLNYILVITTDQKGIIIK